MEKRSLSWTWLAACMLHPCRWKLLPKRAAHAHAQLPCMHASSTRGLPIGAAWSSLLLFGAATLGREALRPSRVEPKVGLYSCLVILQAQKHHLGIKLSLNKLGPFFRIILFRKVVRDVVTFLFGLFQFLENLGSLSRLRQPRLGKQRVLELLACLGRDLRDCIIGTKFESFGTTSSLFFQKDTFSNVGVGSWELKHWAS